MIPIIAFNLMLVFILSRYIRRARLAARVLEHEARRCGVEEYRAAVHHLTCRVAFLAEDNARLEVEQKSARETLALILFQVGGDLRVSQRSFIDCPRDVALAWSDDPATGDRLYRLVPARGCGEDYKFKARAKHEPDDFYSEDEYPA